MADIPPTSRHTHLRCTRDSNGITSNTAIDDAERFNHSCDPNVGVKGQVICWLAGTLR